MAQVSRATFASDLAAKINDNSSGEITPLDLREVFTDLEDSAIWHDEALASLNAALNGSIASLSGADTALITGTAGNNGDVAVFNGDGDVVGGTGTSTAGTISAKAAPVAADRIMIFDTEASNGFATARVDVLGASTSEVNAGTSTARYVTPDALAGSNFGTAVVSLECFAPTEDTATGDGAAYFRVPSTLNGMNLVGVAAAVITAGTTGTTDVQIHNVTDAADMLTTKITIDSGETDSATAATAAVIDAASDDVATGDMLRIDVDAVSTTAAAGLIVELQFRLP